MTKRIVLQKTPKERREENPKLPYFRLVLPPEDEGGEWVEVAALWKNQNGDGYNGPIKEDITITQQKETENSEEKSLEQTADYSALADED